MRGRFVKTANCEDLTLIFSKKEVNTEKGCKKVSLSRMVMLLWTINLFAQGPDTLWTRTYGGKFADWGFSVQETFDGGYIIAGMTFGAGSGDVCLTKTDANGEILWARTYGATNNYDEGRSVQQTSDGGYIVVGLTESVEPDIMNVYLVKTDAKGDTLWTRIYGGEIDVDVGESVQQTSDGGYIIAGYTGSFIYLDYSVYLVKTNIDGVPLWGKTYGGTQRDVGYSAQQTSDGGYIIVGFTNSFDAGKSSIYLIKTDENGDTLWTRTYGGTDWDVGSSVQQTSDEGYIIAGYTESFGAGGADVYLIRTDANGDTLWTKTYGGRYDDIGLSVQETSDKGYIVAGYTHSSWDNADVYLIKTNANGDTIWTKTYGGDGNDYGYSVQQTSDGGYIIAGYTGSFGAGGGDVYLIKTKPDIGIEEKELSQEIFFVSEGEPNPFSQKTIISYQLPVETVVSLKVYDINGRLVRTLLRAKGLEPRVYTVTWDGRNNTGKKVSSGVYFLRIEAAEYNTTRKLLIMR